MAVLIIPERSQPASILGLALSSDVHLAYITNDRDAALEHFEALGIAPWSKHESPLRAIDGTTVVGTLLGSFAHLTGRMFEVFEPSDDIAPLFLRPTGNELVIEFHHVGTRIETNSAAVKTAAAEAGLDHYVRTGPRGDIVYVDTRRTLGHWLEVICMTPEKEE